jgi:cation diffusion facilitator CzcD-associated flavoprotein CzcO
MNAPESCPITRQGDMSQWAAQLISPEVAHRVGAVLGLGSNTKYDTGPLEGELTNMWKSTRQVGLWFHGALLKLGAAHVILAVNEYCRSTILGK